MYSYTIKTVRTLERARRLERVWHQATLALLSRFRPRGVFLWNGRYLSYNAVSAAWGAAGQVADSRTNRFPPRFGCTRVRFAGALRFAIGLPLDR